MNRGLGSGGKNASSSSSRAGNISGSRSNSSGNNAPMTGMVTLSTSGVIIHQAEPENTERKSPWAPIDTSQVLQSARIVSSDGSIMPRPGDVPASMLRHSGSSNLGSATSSSNQSRGLFANPGNKTAPNLSTEALGHGLSSSSIASTSAGSTAASSGAATSSGDQASVRSSGSRQGSRGGRRGGDHPRTHWDSRERTGPKGSHSSRGGRGGYGGSSGYGNNNGPAVQAASISAAAAAAALAAKNAALPPSMTNASKAAQHKASLAAAAAAAAAAASKPQHLETSEATPEHSKVMEAPDLKSERLFGSPSTRPLDIAGSANVDGVGATNSEADANGVSKTKANIGGSRHDVKPGALTAASAAAAAERAQLEIQRQQQQQEQWKLRAARKIATNSAATTSAKPAQTQQQQQAPKSQTQTQIVSANTAAPKATKTGPSSSAAAANINRAASVAAAAMSSNSETNSSAPVTSSSASLSNVTSAKTSSGATERNWRSTSAAPAGARAFSSSIPVGGSSSSGGGVSPVITGPSTVATAAAPGDPSREALNQRASLFGRAISGADDARNNGTVSREAHAALREQLNRARADLDKERRSCDASKREITTMRKSNQLLQDKADRAQRETRDLRRELESVRGDRDNLKRRVAELQRDVSAQEAKLREARVALVRAQTHQSHPPARTAASANTNDSRRRDSASSSNRAKNSSKTVNAYVDDLVSTALESFSADSVWKEAYDLDESSVQSLPYDDKVRPQRKFEVDNTTTPFIPSLQFKPHGVTPLNSDKLLSEPWTSPYTDEINRLRFANSLPFKTPQKFRNPHNLPQFPFQFVEQEYQLEELARLLDTSGLKEVGVSVQNHSFRSYQGFLCLIQISTYNGDFVIDALALRRSIHVLAPFFANPSIVKVLYGAEGAVRWLQRDFNIYIVNMIDLRIAAAEMDLKNDSFASMLKHFLQVELNTNETGADWRLRPLSFEQLKYAQQFSHYLLDIYHYLWYHGGEDLLRKVFNQSCSIALQSYQKRSITQESINAKLVELQRAHDDTQQFSVVQRGVFTALAHWRDLVARIRDESVDYVMNDDVLYSLAKLGPITSEQLDRAIESCRNPTAPLLMQLRGSVFFCNCSCARPACACATSLNVSNWIYSPWQHVAATCTGVCASASQLCACAWAC
mmetsp:Transcript_14646/g.28371  ORF Transcript_14646/g.28371 Transcript_14646/m.28371 type:complete len:1159 (-) Transcript_14646:308-3784(-)